MGNILATLQGTRYMSYLGWLVIVAMTGWASGKIWGGKALGRVSDVLLGILGASLVRFISDLGVVHLESVYFLLFSVWGAAAPPAIVRLWLRRNRASNQNPELETPRSIETSQAFDEFPGLSPK